MDTLTYFSMEESKTQEVRYTPLYIFFLVINISIVPLFSNEASISYALQDLIPTLLLINWVLLVPLFIWFSKYRHIGVWFLRVIILILLWFSCWELLWESWNATGWWWDSLARSVSALLWVAWIVISTSIFVFYQIWANYNSYGRKLLYIYIVGIMIILGWILQVMFH